MYDMNLFIFSLIYIKVMSAGTTCGTGSRVQAATASSLVALGFYKSNPSNVAPDWGLIIGKLTVIIVHDNGSHKAVDIFTYSEPSF
jgi:hypothetical protein